MTRCHLQDSSATVIKRGKFNGLMFLHTTLKSEAIEEC